MEKHLQSIVQLRSWYRLNASRLDANYSSLVKPLVDIPIPAFRKWLRKVALYSLKYKGLRKDSSGFGKF
jgi:hypothetical protein